MKILLTLAVTLGMTGGAYAADFNGLSGLTAPKVKAAIPADGITITPARVFRSETSKAGPEKVKFGFVSEAERNEYIAKAQLWAPEGSLNVAALDFKKGPFDPLKYVPEELVTCKYIPTAVAYEGETPSGKTPKFKCEDPKGKKLKIKYGKDNGEVQCEVAATWIMTAIGAGADRMYPITLTCPDCPSDPFVSEADPGAWVNGQKVATEDKLGERIEITANSGVGFDEFYRIEDRVGAEALAGLAQFLGNTDNKAANNAISCEKKDVVADPATGKAGCLKPIVHMQDVGITFGGKALYHNKRMNFESWAKEKVWLDPAKCIMSLNEVGTGSLKGVDASGRNLHQIGEQARQLLVRRMSMLSRAQLADIFTAARAPERAPMHSAEEWADLFIRKVNELRYPLGENAGNFSCLYDVVPPNSAQAPAAPAAR